MADLIVKEWSDEVLPPDSIVTATLQELKVVTIEYTDKKSGEDKSFDKAEWWWEITDDHRDGDFVGRKVKGECNPEITTHPKNKMRNWIEALLGIDLDAGTQISTDDVIGLRADISIKHREAVIEGEDRVFMEVDEVMPVADDGDDVPF